MNVQFEFELVAGWIQQTAVEGDVLILDQFHE